ncbi:Heterokaryon incompatibility protein 6, OR allele [Fusarium odoratissimum]|uniref:Heterokaryon incompatibility protein 6, OR allele n=1 Tax=Fusarium oxysporum f. sp. cubense (strain race 4) TaxID=2502994 RepID=N1SBV0_FUSC4|nr:Heterokaryon incompatibility protein 6, OR allele [Fusarium odoratissimum]
MPFKYDELPNNDFFRIFELKCGKDDEPLQGNLRTHVRKEAPKYEALSYMWGSPDRVKHMECNDHEFMITSSLDSALRRLRLARESRYLWIDQICINQESPNERSEQVCIMRDIYSGSVLVTAWLGPADPGEAADTRMIISALAAIRFHVVSKQQYFPENERLQELGLPTRESPAWGALNSMLQAPYFSRVWIIQELAVAPTYDLLWGDLLIPKVDFEAFKTATLFLCMLYPDPNCLDLSRGRGPSKGVCPKIEWSIPMGFTDDAWKQGQDLLELVCLTKRCHATDPADKIFALIGLAGEKTYGIVPDYTKTKPEVFTEFALKVISETRNLEILNYCDVEDPTVEERLPLWAPRWHHEVTRHYYNMTGYGFKSSNDMEIAFHTSTNTKVLQLKGLHIDRVKETHSQTLQMDQNAMAISRMIIEHESLLKDQYGLDIIRPIVLTMLNGRVRSILLEVHYDRPKDDSYLQLFTAFALRSLLTSFVKDGDDGGSNQRAMIQLIKMAVDSSPSATPCELIWKEPETWEFFKDRLDHLYPHDMEIASSYLEVLRRVSCDIEKDSVNFVQNTASSTSDEGLFLGNAYVHGIMDGEAITTWEEQKDSQDPKFRERLFKLI